MGTVKVIRVYFLEEDVIDGAIPMEAYENAWETEHTDLSAREAADLIQSLGLSFAATNNDWAADPDGSQIENYQTGRRVETTAHLEGFPDRVHDAIIAAVG